MTFLGSAVIPAGSASPIQVDPHNVVVRTDGAVGLGYVYQATGGASGQIPGTFAYNEHGYLFFKNSADPTSLIGSQFTSGVFILNPHDGGLPIQIADTDPGAYTSGIQSGSARLGTRLSGDLRSLIGHAGQLTYGYFTFTDNHGTFTGYATPDFTRFAIQISFSRS